MIEFTLNGQAVRSNSPADTPLLWVIRDELGFKGTKFGCGIGQCGACTVHMDDTAIRSCGMPLAAVSGRNITTIEGLNSQHPLQQAWVEEQVPQCGYCQSGQIMQAATLLAQNASPSEQEIAEHMKGNLCRCMAYTRIKKAISVAGQRMNSGVQTFNPAQEEQA